MKKILKMLSIFILATGLTIWVLHGANTGWTKTQKEITKVDEITGIEYREYEDKLTFGIELPVVTVLLSTGLFGLSLIFKSQKQS